MEIDYFFLSKTKFYFNNLNWQKEIIKVKKEKQISEFRTQEIVQFKDFDENTSLLVKNLINKIVKKKNLYGSRVEICQFQKTSKGGVFNWHTDYMDGRNCVSIIYLSDNNDGLIGGATEFNFQNGQEIKIITPKNGYCCCFDPKILHKGARVIDGNKYSLVIVFNANNKIKTEHETNSMGQKKLIYYKLL
jgi:hypothetical protein